MCSIAKHNPDRPFCFHICTPKDELPKIQRELLERIKTLYPQFSYELYAFEDFSGFYRVAFRVNKRMATQCIRLFASELRNLHGNILLYLDTDILCYGNIPAFNELNFNT